MLPLYIDLYKNAVLEPTMDLFFWFLGLSVLDEPALKISFQPRLLVFLILRLVLANIHLSISITGMVLRHILSMYTSCNRAAVQPRLAPMSLR